MHKKIWILQNFGGWIRLVDDCVITFLPAKACGHRITTRQIWLTDKRLVQELKWLSFTKFRHSPANLEQLESCYEKDRNLQFHDWAVELWKSLCYGTICIHQRILAHGSHGGRCKFIIVVVSTLEMLTLDVAVVFTASDVKFRYITPQFGPVLLCCLNCLPKVAVALSKPLSNGCFVTSISLVGDKVCKVYSR